MQTIETVQGWSGVLADLTAKRQSARDHLEQLRAQKKDLALEAAMGSTDAKRKLDKTNAELNKLAFELDDSDMAIAQAEAQKQQAEAVEATTAEQQRREQIAVNLGQYFVAVQEIDDGLRLLAARFAVARQHLDRAEVLMIGQERAPFVQLRSLWGATLAAAHFGLGDHIQLGDRAANYAHRQPLASYAAPFVKDWGVTRKEETTNGRP